MSMNSVERKNGKLWTKTGMVLLLMVLSLPLRADGTSHDADRVTPQAAQATPGTNVQVTASDPGSAAVAQPRTAKTAAITAVPMDAKVTTVKQSNPVEATPITEVSAKWGIEILALRRTAGNQMLDFRYRVLDPVKAAPLFGKDVQPYLVDEKTMEKLLVPNPPKVGPLRTTRAPKADKNYFIMFGNPGEYMKQGSLATIVMGGLKVEHIIVE